MSIWIRKKQAVARARQEKKERSARRSRPALEALSLPEDATGSLTRLILMGNGRALVENLLGIVEIDGTRVRLATRAGLLTFHGRGLRLTDVRRDALAVVGEIDSVELPHAEREEANADD